MIRDAFQCMAYSDWLPFGNVYSETFFNEKGQSKLLPQSTARGFRKIIIIRSILFSLCGPHTDLFLQIDDASAT